MDAINELIQQISDKCRRDGDTYVRADGLIICCNCNTPRQKYISFMGGAKLVNCLCKCLKAKEDAEERKQQDQKRQDEIRRNRADGIREQRWISSTFSASDEPLDRERRYCNNFKAMYDNNAGIMFMGEYGSGKTYRAACIANELISQGYRVLMVNITALCMEIQSTFDKDEYINSLKAYDLLILDDIGAERKTDYMIELLYTIIDTRYRSQKPLIITTNLSAREMMECEDGRLKRTYDRLIEMCPYPIAVTGKARRKDAGNAKYQMLKELIG